MNSLRDSFSKIEAKINIVSGEGILDEAPSIEYGEKLGSGEFELDVSLDPIDGTTMVAQNKMDAMVILAVAPKNTLMVVPDMYMEKLVTSNKLKNKLSLNNTIEENIKIASNILNKPISEIVIGCLNKPRHNELKESIKKIGAKIKSVDDGDVSLSIMVGSASEIDFMYLIGGAPEGITSSVVIKSFDGDMQARLMLKKDIKGQTPENIEYSKVEEEQIRKLNLEINKIYYLDDLCSTDNVFFVSTNITTGSMGKGVHIMNKQYVTNSVILTGKNSRAMKVKTRHDINKI